MCGHTVVFKNNNGVSKLVKLKIHIIALSIPSIKKKKTFYQICHYFMGQGDKGTIEKKIAVPAFFFITPKFTVSVL